MAEEKIHKALPVLIGSPKQTEWGFGLRKIKLQQLFAYANKLREAEDMTEGEREVLDEAVDNIRLKADVKYWIAIRFEDIKKLVTQEVNRIYKQRTE